MGGGIKVLVVEDEPLIRVGIASALEDAGFQTYEAPHADAAIAILEKRTDIRLVVTDVDMPGSMDGLKLAHYVRHRWPPIHLIVISGKVGVLATELPSGARFFSKPYPEHDFLEAIRDMLRGASGGPTA